MPKLIPQLEDNIIKTAENLFSSEGFDGVSMRRLATELDIAVGTLYNYFPNKTILFYSIMNRSWENTFEQIDILVKNTDIITSDSRRSAMEIIYDGIRDRGAFALKTFEPADSEKHAHKLKTHDPDWQKKLIIKLTEKLKPLGGEFSGPEAERTVKTILATIRFFIFSSETGDKDGDINFLIKITETR